MQFLKNMFLLILYGLILTSNSNSGAKAFDVDFLRSLNSITRDIRSWVFRNYSNDILVTTLDEHGIKSLSSSDANVNDRCLIPLRNVVWKMLEALECFHSVLSFSLFKILRDDYIQIKKNPLEKIRITVWQFYLYLTRMDAVFSYGNFEVQDWQLAIYTRIKNILFNADSMEDFIENLEYYKDRDDHLRTTMIEFANKCQTKNYLPQTDNITNVITKSYKTLSYYDWFICKTKIPCILSLESTNSQLKLPDSQKFLAERRPEQKKITTEFYLERLQLNESEMSSLRDPTEFDVCKYDWTQRMSDTHFGDVCRLSHNKPDKIVTLILRNELIETDVSRYEKSNKEVAKKKFANETSFEVTAFGGCADKKFNYLSAKPDGLIGDNGILIVKCPHNAPKTTPQDAVKKGQLQFLTEQENGNIILDRRAKYYYQVQGQLHITKKEHCYFVVWTPHGLFYDKIYRDDDFWTEKMENKLTSFYINHWIPKIVGPTTSSLTKNDNEEEEVEEEEEEGVGEEEEGEGVGEEEEGEGVGEEGEEDEEDE